MTMEPKKVFLDTDHHVYSIEDLMGRGAQGNIYKGIHKTTGEVHALKLFEKYNLQTQREMDALSKLEHPNIVKFYECEKDCKGNHVIIMELCERGSLLDLIRKPENITGIDEDEFLRVFSHLVCGMKHLRKSGFSHRDIKPGNILVCIGEDGRNIYKLSDFGTAKPLNDNDFFVSLVGTDEYLHPDIYKAAFIDKRKHGTFTIAADLWSLGATLYHTVTGKVPFNPYIGRDDKDVMFEMISGKSSGVISGEQVSAGGSIHWKTDLPKTCRLSSSMNASIRTILVNLLESDKGKIWSFEEFFDAADELLSRKPVHVFYPNNCTQQMSYLKQDTNFRELQDVILSECRIPCDHQYVLYRDNLVKDVISDRDSVLQYIYTNCHNPLIVVDTSKCTEKTVPCSINYEFWEKVVFDEEMPRFEYTDRTVFDVSRDYQVAKLLCAKMFLMEKITKRLEICQNTLQQTVFVCRKLLKQKIDNCSRDLEFLRKRFDDIRVLTEHSKIEKFTAITREGDEADDDYTMTKKRIVNCEKKLSDLCNLHKEDDKIFQVHPTCLHCHQEATNSEKKIRRHIELSEELLKKFMERRNQRFTVHIEYMHNFDRKNIQDHSKEIRSIMNKCKIDLETKHTEFLLWNRHYTDENIKVLELEESLTEANFSVDDLIQTLKELHSLEPPIAIPAIGEKTLKRKQFLKDVSISVEDMQKNITESKMLVVQSREQLDSLSSLMSELPDLHDIDFPTLTNGMDSFSDSGTSYLEDVVDFKR